uniref:Uncharacterized protein n=1 Tax=Brassica campestris TaxID=3711 RepID=M4DXG1_BRACM
MFSGALKLPLATIGICRASESVAFSSSEAYSTTSSILRTDDHGRNQTQPNMVPRRQAYGNGGGQFSEGEVGESGLPRAV